ncbi:unnamed protein product [Miscanthus lutarioriparius]|uniref:Uncharacterized protein n=1 Tax=Miscanthus lutarioriparius TaxID=422564 RepID=A0A811MY63_9POAL|nr:unnamed protein product [Miscanthus lutarioriparius]
MASLGRPDAILVPRCPVIFNGTNWGDFVFHMEVHMDGQLLWGYLTGERICPPRPLLPTPPTYPPDADDDAKNDLLEAFEAEMESYQSDLGVYETWLREEKSAKAILLASMEVDLSLFHRGLATSHLMWDHLCRSYEIRNEAMYLAVVEEAQSLRQFDSTVEGFHRQMTAVWHRLDSLGTEFCGGGAPSGIQCGYCKIYGHEEKDCRKKQRDRSGRCGRHSFQGSGGSSTSQSTRSVSAAEQEVLGLFRRLTTAAQASGHGTTAQASSSTPPPSGSPCGPFGGNWA